MTVGRSLAALLLLLAAVPSLATPPAVEAGRRAAPEQPAPPSAAGMDVTSMRCVQYSEEDCTRRALVVASKPGGLCEARVLPTDYFYAERGRPFYGLARAARIIPDEGPADRSDTVLMIVRIESDAIQDVCVPRAFTADRRTWHVAGLMPLPADPFDPRMAMDEATRRAGSARGFAVPRPAAEPPPPLPGITGPDAAGAVRDPGARPLRDDMASYRVLEGIGGMFARLLFGSAPEPLVRVEVSSRQLKRPVVYGKRVIGETTMSFSVSAYALPDLFIRTEAGDMPISRCPHPPDAPNIYAC